MSEHPSANPISELEVLEPERYELFEAPTYQFGWSRREFFKRLGGGIVVLFALQNGSPPEAQAQESGGGGRRRQGGSQPQDIGAWLHIGEDGVVSAFTGKTEVGQNIRTSLSQVVAEELRVPITSIRMVMADTDLTPYDAGTFGSRTTPAMAPQLRKAAVAAREALLDLAAEQWKVDRNTLVISDGKITQPGKSRSLSFGQLTRGQKLLKTIGEEALPTPATQWKTAGRSVPKVEGRAIITGKHQYTSDMRLPGMVYGKVLRPSTLGATLATLDSKAAAAMPGVSVVRDGDFVGVTAPNTQAAAQAIEVLRVEWKATPQSSSQKLFDELRADPPAAKDPNTATPAPEGSIPAGEAVAEKIAWSTYTIAYIAHAPLEPRAAVAQWEGDKLTVWTGTQRPFGVRGELAGAFRIGEDRVRVIVPDTGSGYGGKHTGEAAIEAARLAKTAGKPVKLVWTREEEFTWAYFRPAGVIDVKGSANADGTLSSWEFHNYNSGNSGIETPYNVANKKIEFHRTRSPLRQGSYRGLASVANNFARESTMDDLAHSLKIDPLEFRLKNLQDARLRAVFEAAANRFGWNKKPAPGNGFGIGGGYEKGGYVATCAEVSVTRGAVKVLRTVTAFECGAIINPDHLKNQVEGAVVMGLGGALFEAIEFENGKISNASFAQYRVPRFRDVPPIEIVLLDRKDLPSAGAGECPIIGIAPAIGNAIFNATGQRIRSLPLAPKGIIKL